VERLISSARVEDQNQIAAQNEAIRKLSGEIGLTEGAVRAVLSSLGKDQGPAAENASGPPARPDLLRSLDYWDGQKKPAPDNPTRAAGFLRLTRTRNGGHGHNCVRWRPLSKNAAANADMIVGCLC